MLFKKYQRNAFLNYCRLYISKYVHCDMRFLVVKISALLCIPNGFGIAVPVVSYEKPCADPEGGQAVRTPPPPEKSQKYRVS